MSESHKSEQAVQTARAAQFKQKVLDYHRLPAPGKIAIAPTKDLFGVRDLSLAYTPGIGLVCEEIAADELASFAYTARGNLVGVITNGTAVLGLGDIRPAAAKPVMEGKSVLFKKFANIDVFDIELNHKDPRMLIEIIAAMEPTFGGINLEDIKAPDCFLIDEALRARLNIPVFHDDQHGTAIVVCAAILNALILVEKPIGDIKLVVSGAGAAALACVNMLVDLGLSKEHVWLSDLAGAVYAGRVELMDKYKARFAQDTAMRTLDHLIDGADIFLGLSAAKVLKPAMVAKMASRPIIMALANPVPEIMPEEVMAVRSDAIIATGRSDYPNQVNNLLCFPFIFRGALDVGARAITTQMQVAAVRALAELARQEQNDVVSAAYGNSDLQFGPGYLIPKPFDPRLMAALAPAVAKAAMESGVASRPITDWQEYRSKLQAFVYRSGALMEPIFAVARSVELSAKRLVYTEGEDERILRAVQVVIDEKLAAPILIGRPRVVASQIKKFGLRLNLETDIAVVNIESSDHYDEYWQSCQRMAGRMGVSPKLEQIEMRHRLTLIGAMLMQKGAADGMLCGPTGDIPSHLHYIGRVLVPNGVQAQYGGMSGLLWPGHEVFFIDAYANPDPTAEEIASLAKMAIKALHGLGEKPKVALLFHSDFGSSDSLSARKMRRVRDLLLSAKLDAEIYGEMQGDSALDEKICASYGANSSVSGSANLLVFPNLDAAKISFGLLKSAAGNGVVVGPILLGAPAAVHILSPVTTIRGIVNMSALAVMDAKSKRG